MAFQRAGIDAEVQGGRETAAQMREKLYGEAGGGVCSPAWRALNHRTRGVRRLCQLQREVSQTATSYPAAAAAARFSPWPCGPAPRPGGKP